VFQKLVGPGRIVVDVGAHWGYFTLLAATLCGERGQVFSFEPHPYNYAILGRNIQANHLSNVAAIQKAVSNREGPAKLHVSEYSHCHCLQPVARAARVSSSPTEVLQVETATLDNFFVGKQIAPNLIKMDVEGAEPLALEGMESLIRRTDDLVLITEFNPVFLDSDAAESFTAKLSTLGFQLAIIDDQKHRLEFGPRAKILGRLLGKEYTTNLLCTRNDAHIKSIIGEREPRRGPHRTPTVVHL
jgi:FkbM family methyltransferase